MHFISSASWKHYTTSALSRRLLATWIFLLRYGLGESIETRDGRWRSEFFKINIRSENDRVPKSLGQTYRFVQDEVLIGSFLLLFIIDHLLSIDRDKKM